jgi:hypothetical protein
MDYIFYLLTVLAIGSLCVVKIWLGTRSKNAKVTRQHAARHSQGAVAVSGTLKTTRKSRSRSKSAATTATDSHLGGRDRHYVRAVWGW